jgi:hypothetical protein
VTGVGGHSDDHGDEHAALREVEAAARRLVAPRDVRPTAARAAAGWELRFLADRMRAEEAVRLYEQLGFEVAADPVTPEGLPEGCTDCVLATALGFRMIYTRRRASRFPEQYPA